jgi:hypothetical protein
MNDDEKERGENIVMGVFGVVFVAAAVGITIWWWRDPFYGQSVWNLVGMIFLAGGSIAFLTALVVAGVIDAWKKFQDL